MNEDAVCSAVIEHLDDPAVLLRNARDYMSEGCYLILTAPGGPMSAFDWQIGHRKHWRRQEIESLLCEAGYAPEIVTGAGFPFFNLYRGLVILRTRRLISDVSSGHQGASLPAKTVMAVFRRVLRLKTNSCRWGWQLVARART